MIPMNSLLTIGAALALLAVPAAVAQGDWQNEYHDFGTDLGAFGPNPLATETGVCWATDREAPEDYNGGRHGLAVDPEGCDGKPVGEDADPADRPFYNGYLIGCTAATGGCAEGDALSLTIFVEVDGTSRAITIAL